MAPDLSVMNTGTTVIQHMFHNNAKMPAATDLKSQLYPAEDELEGILVVWWRGNPHTYDLWCHGGRTSC